MANKPWRYGDPAPTNWQECAEIIRGMGKKPTKKNKKSELMSRLDELERMMKEKGK